MKVSFSKTETVETPVPGVTIDVTTSAVPAESEGKAESIPTSAASNPHAVARREPRDDQHAVFDDNDIKFEDLRMSRLNLVQRVGPLSEVYPPGAIVLDSSNELYVPAIRNEPATPPLVLTVIGFKKTVFVEKIEGGAMGALYRTEDDVVANGGTLDFKEWKQSVAAAKESGGKPLRRFDRMATALILVEKPEAFPDPNQTVFPYECEGRFCKLVFWSLKASLYNGAAKIVFTDRKFGPMRDIKDKDGKVIGGGYTSNRYLITTELRNFPGGNASWVPKFDVSAKNSPEFRAFIRGIIGLE